MSKSIVVLNGPNLNLLGSRETEQYGTASLADIEALCRERAAHHGLELTFKQTNHEGDLVDWLQEAGRKADGVVINPAGYTHTSVALQDAVRAIEIPVIELHVSNIYAREPFRRHSYVSAVADGVICGLGMRGYGLAIDALAERIGQ